MTAPIRLSAVGDGELARALRSHGAPFGRVRLVESEAEAVLVDLPAGARAPAVAEALGAGGIVLCPPPVARDAAELHLIEAAARRGGGRLLPAGEIAHGPAGRHGLAAIAAPAFGTLRSLYLAIRQPRGPGDDVLDALLPEALDAVLSILPGPFTLRVNAGALFDRVRDTVVVLLRAASGPVVTLELSRCLPASLPAPGLGEVELDAMGAHQAVRIAPHTCAVRVHRDDGAEHVPWLDPPVLAMLQALEAAVDGTAADGLARARAALALSTAIRAAADQAFTTS